MRIRWQPLTPLAAVIGGVLAGAAGTVCLDAVHYVRYRKDGGTKTPLEWEFAAVDTWADAPVPGQVGKRVIEGFTQRELPDRWAWPVSTLMHWGYGSSARTFLSYRQIGLYSPPSGRMTYPVTQTSAPNGTPYQGCGRRSDPASTPYTAPAEVP